MSDKTFCSAPSLPPMLLPVAPANMLGAMVVQPTQIRSSTTPPLPTTKRGRSPISPLASSKTARLRSTSSSSPSIQG